MAEYIDREEYCEKHCRCSNEYCDKERCPIWKAPTVDAEVVVRCKDCKRLERHTEVNRDYGGCRRYNSTMRYDDFCSYGERKEGAGNG